MDKNIPYVVEICDESPAFMAGLKNNDIILEVNGESISDLQHDLIIEKMKSNKYHIHLLVVDNLENMNQSRMEMNF